MKFSVFYIIVALASFLANSLFAATISIREDQELGCKIFLEGEILSGDAERLRQVVRQVLQKPDMRSFWGNTGVEHGQRLRVCFNSPGGSFLEGIELARILMGENDSDLGFGDQVIGAAVPSNAVCKSACAVAFMGGTETFETGDLAPDRILHPSATLGFHAPELIVPDDNYQREQVEQAYGLALASIARIVKTRNEGRYDFPESLLERMLETSPRDMFYIETLAQAELWGINVHSRGIYASSIDEISRNICEAADSRLHAIYLGTNRGYSLQAWDSSIAISQDSEGTRAEVVIASGFGPSPDPGRTFPCTLDFRLVGSSSETNLGAVVIRDLTPNEYLNLYKIRNVMTFPSETKIAQIPYTSQITVTQFMNLFTSQSSRQQGTPTYNSFWDHNGSRMGLVADGSRRLFYYAEPRAVLVERGVQRGTLLFEGERRGNRYVGEARIFARLPCGEFTYPVEGPVAGDQRSVTMFGQAPRVNERCQVTSYRDDTLVFTLE